jgi:hypothetical protein
VQHSRHPYQLSIVGRQFAKGYGLNVAASDLLFAAFHNPGQIGSRSLHRFDTDLLYARGDWWRRHFLIDKKDHGKKPRDDESDR